MMSFRINILLLLICMVVGIGWVIASEGVIQRGEYLERSDVQAFIQSVHKEHGVPLQKIQTIIGQASRQQSILDLMSKPAEGKPWSEYRPIFLTEKRISQGVDFWNKHESTLIKAQKMYGVPAEIITAIIGVETFYGTRMGKSTVLDALASLGFDYPPRAKFFKKELAQFLLLIDEEKIDPLSVKGSYAGAMGMGQFIPSSYRNYAVDFDKDGDRDLFYSPEDAIGSVANYFYVHKWIKDGWVISRATITGAGHTQLKANQRKPSHLLKTLNNAGVYTSAPITPNEKLIYLNLQGDKQTEHWVGHHNFFVITQYNHSVKYALAVFQLSQEIKKRRSAKKKTISHAEPVSDFKKTSLN